MKEECGLPICKNFYFGQNLNLSQLIESDVSMKGTYFSALKIKWLMDNVLQVKDAIKEGRCKFGTVDTWVLWVN